MISGDEFLGEGGMDDLSTAFQQHLNFRKKRCGKDCGFIQSSIIYYTKFVSTRQQINSYWVIKWGFTPLENLIIYDGDEKYS